MKNRFTIQIRGNVLADNQNALQQQIENTLATFPQFKLTFSSVETWQDPNGNPRVFRDDGTEYFESDETDEETEVTEKANDAESV